MVKKMYYNEQEAVEKVGGPDELKRLVDEGKIQSYRDGDKNMYKADQVDSLGAGGEEGGDEEEIELAPMEEESPGGQEQEQPPDLSQADVERPAGKEDTVISAEGVSIFDAEDLDIEEPADPMAKTQIAPSLEDEVAIEGAGGGSGLLDLTRESDETSLGADVLEHIEETTGPEGPPVEEISEETPVAQAAAAAPVEQPVYEEIIEPSSGLFQALVGVCAVAVLLLVPVALAAVAGALPGYLKWMAANAVVILVCLVLLSGIAGALGWFLAKSVADRQAAMRR